ncbi:pyruvoyl-dependent arginine decarboxylase [Patescibacteria group bacterium]|nr:pyruvoyl-dependent arginine decarboxylase [Patescibacteria group bacterium]
MENKLKIHICKGFGEGSTTMSAFDNALINAGIANYNLIYLSSIIPEGSIITTEKFISNIEDYGNRLYIVIARFNQTIIDNEAWAGIGWVQDEEGRGLFVEHFAESKDSVIGLIEHSMSDMKQNRDFKYKDIKYAVTGTKCYNKPVCAIVAAVFKSQDW